MQRQFRVEHSSPYLLQNYGGCAFKILFRASINWSSPMCRAPRRASAMSIGLKGLLFVSAVLFATLPASKPAWGQVAGATLSGTVTDPSGSAVPSVKVSLTNMATGVTRDVAGDNDGLYSVPNLVPGTYQVTISAQGFGTLVISNVVLTVGEQHNLNETLKISQVNEMVDVKATAATVEGSSSAISNEVDATTVRELPLNGRDWTQLATLQPGVSTVAGQASLTSSSSPRTNRGFGNQMTISGARPQQNNYRLDGVSIDDYTGGGPGSVLGGDLGVDAIQEFSVLTVNQGADYGKTSGGVINATTKSGTNQFHGDGYEFLRNDVLDAKSYFDQSQIPPFRRNQFGGAAGDAIRKDHTFIFGDYEGLRQSQGITNVNIVPSVAARNGNLCSNPSGVTPACTPTTITVSPSVSPYFVFFPLPNGPSLGNGDTGVYNSVTNDITNEDFFTIRFDQVFSDRDSFFGTYMYDKSLTNQPDSLLQDYFNTPLKRQMVTLEDSHTFSSSLVNSLRFGYTRIFTRGGIQTQAINPATDDQSLAFVPVAGKHAGVINVTGLTSFSGGLCICNTGSYGWNTFQLYDDGFVTRGKHNLKLGFGLERDQMNALVPGHANGNFNFGSLQNFLEDIPSEFDAALPTQITPRDYRQTILAGYFQDDFHWRPNFTLNLGLRYEMSTVPTDVGGKLATLLSITSPTPHLGSPYFANPTKRNFEPRVGFAWDPFKNGKTAIRGAFGIFDVLPELYQDIQAPLTYPFYEQVTLQGPTLPPGSFPTSWYSNLAPTNFREDYIDPNPPRNYVMEWNLNVQRAIARDFTAMVAYVGTRGIHQLFRTNDMDMVMPTLTPQGYLWPIPHNSGTKINPNFGQIVGRLWNADSYYDALQAQLTKHLSHNLELQGSYTWGKSIDTGSNSTTSNNWAQSNVGLLWFAPQTRRGLSDFNVGQNVVVSYTWVVPSPKWGGVAGWATGGWETGGVFTAQGGQPFSAYLGGDPLGQESMAAVDYPNRVPGAGCSSLVIPGDVTHYIKTQCLTYPTPAELLGNLGRNSLIGPGLMNMDFSLFKNNYIRKVSESFDVQFRAELFNVFNHPNFASPTDNDTAFNAQAQPVAAFGRLDALTTAPREIQFALKVIW